MRKAPATAPPEDTPQKTDRKSTRLNSSHVRISYAVFCLKKKKTRDQPGYWSVVPPLRQPTRAGSRRPNPGLVARRVHPPLHLPDLRRRVRTALDTSGLHP